MPDKKAPSFAETIIGKRGRPEEAAAEPEDVIGAPSPRARPGTGQDLMLELRFKDARITALSYSYLVRADFCPEKGITLSFSSCEVKVEGSNLQSLYGEVVSHRRSWIAEEPASVLLARSAESPTPHHVSRITVLEPNEEES